MGDRSEEFQRQVAEPGVWSWLWLLTLGSNLFYGGYDPRLLKSRAIERPRATPSKAQSMALHLLAQKVDYFLDLDVVVPCEDWAASLKSARIAYDGSAVERAQRLSWPQVLPVLPRPEHCASIPAEKIAEGVVKEFLENPRWCLLDLDALEAPPKAGALLIQPGEDLVIAKELISRGLCVALEEHELFKIGSGFLLNGVFGVPKGEQLGPDASSRRGQDVLRFIMNLTASNSVQELWAGDINLLPHFGMWRFIMLEGEQELAWSWPDLKGCFYLFRLRRTWAPLFAFNWHYEASELGVPGHGRRWLASVNLPMGWKSAMGLVQYLHRKPLMRTGAPSRALPVPRELRKDRAVPPLLPGGGDMSALWQIYADDLDVPEIFSSREDLEAARAGGSAAYYDAARARYAAREVPTSAEKAGDRLQIAQRLGARIDGAAGVVGADARRIGRIIGMTLHVLTKDAWSAKELQVLGGHWTHLFQFRREASSLLVHFWPLLTTALRRRKVAATELVRTELWLCVVHLPLLAVSLRSAIDPVVTASDASEQGGGRLRIPGLHTHRAPGRATDGLGLDSLCDGIGGARQALHLLGITPAMYCSSEVDDAALRVIRARWPEAVELGGTESICQATFDPLARKFCNLSLIVVVLGAPSHGPSLLFRFVEAVAAVRRAFAYCEVLWLAKSVPNMGAQSEEQFSGLLDQRPLHLCLGLAGPVRRPRLYWTSWGWSVTACCRSRVSTTQRGLEAVVEAPWPSSASALEPGARPHEPTTGSYEAFARAARKKRPPHRLAGCEDCDLDTLARWQADGMRYPPCQYKPANCVWQRRQGASAARLRPLVANEREAMMGYPRGYTKRALGRASQSQAAQLEDARCALIGVSSHAPCIAWLFGSALHEHGLLEARPDFAQCWGTLAEEAADGVLRRLLDSGGGGRSLKEEAVALLHRSAMLKGSDVRRHLA
ncbi:unnamed protein product [Prorocentrum cordatum]|uniref:Uncharacterized protein n=1 Tax=Prorocentrum cordatum TaxID=2364126 RepID=A0ABN9U614_9DINO|nr:unnamed protein product [Polarella glacialis]